MLGSISGWKRDCLKGDLTRHEKRAPQYEDISDDEKPEKNFIDKILQEIDGKKIKKISKNSLPEDNNQPKYEIDISDWRNASSKTKKSKLQKFHDKTEVTNNTEVSPQTLTRKFTETLKILKEVNTSVENKSFIDLPRVYDYGSYQLVHFDEPKKPLDIIEIQPIIPTSESEGPSSRMFPIITNKHQQNSSVQSHILRKEVETKQNLTGVTKLPVYVGDKTKDEFKSPVLKGNWKPKGKIKSKINPPLSVVSMPTSNTKYTLLQKTKESENNMAKVYDPKFIKFMIKECVTQKFNENISYNSNVVVKLCNETSELIKESIKPYYPPRYRVVVTVTAVENKQQGVKLVSRGLYDQQRDKIAEYIYDNGKIIIITLVYAIYKE